MLSEEKNKIINVNPSLKASIDSDDPSLWLDKDEAAKLSNRNKETINKWVRKKSLDKNKIKLKYVQGKTGKEVRIFKPTLLNYLETLGEEAREDYGYDYGDTMAGTTPKSQGSMDDIKHSQGHGTIPDETMVRYVESLEQQVGWLRGQLETVNEQRGRDQLLMLNIQNDNKKLLEQKEEIIEKQEEDLPKKNGWWPFGSN